jgi:hypothetical protein
MRPGIAWRVLSLAFAGASLYLVWVFASAL